MAFDFLSNINKYSGGYNTGDLANNTYSGLNFNYPLSTGETNTLGYSLPYTVDTSNAWGNFVDNLNNYNNRQQILGNIGRLGVGIGTALSSYQSQNMPDYYFAPRWAGNGLATYQTVDNTSRKKNNLSQAYGAGDYLNSLFNKSLSSSKFNKDLNNWAWADAKREQYGL